MKIFLRAIAPGLIFLFLWEMVCTGNPRREFLFASPSLIAHAAIEEFPTPEFWLHAWLTSFEAVLGLLAGTIFGTLAGLALWSNRAVASVIRPYLVFMGAIPVFAVAPMFVIWFGTGLFSKCMMAACGVFFIALHQSFEGATGCSDRLTLYLRSLGVSRMMLVRKVIFPGTVRWMLAGLRVNIGFALMGAFIGEFVSSEAGLGHYILKSGSLYDMPRVLLGVFLLSGIALLLNGVVTLVSNRVRI